MKSTDLAFEVTNLCGAAGCGVCPPSGQCFSQRSNLIFELDLEQDNQQIVSQRTTDVYDFRLGATTSVSLFDDPIRVKNQGLKFSKNKFIESMNTPTIKIPQIFTFEAWVRFDTETVVQSFGDLQYIY